MFGIRLFSRAAATPARPSRVILCLDGLEVRTVPTVVSGFNPASGALTVTVSGDGRGEQDVSVREAGGTLKVNGQPVPGAGGRAAAAADVRSITVNGSGSMNVINLSGVTTARFHGLNGRVAVNAGGGSDVVYGSAFADVLHGDGGNDNIRGENGDDRLYGDAGDDRLDGMDGADTLDGGADNDTLIGGPAADVFVGGAGFDVIYGFRSQDKDRATGVESYR